VSARALAELALDASPRRPRPHRDAERVIRACLTELRAVQKYDGEAPSTEHVIAQCEEWLRGIDTTSQER
jgi:hypothetical protein